MTSRGPLLAGGVVLLFLAIFVPLALRVVGGRDEAIDAARLRRTYVALALYEAEHDGGHAPNLGLVRRDVDPIDLRSVADPGVAGTSFSVDGVLPHYPVRFPTRVSWSYRWHWPQADRAAAIDPRQGLLADPWPGATLTVHMDGSFSERPRGETTFAALFGR